MSKNHHTAPELLNKPQLDQDIPELKNNQDTQLLFNQMMLEEVSTEEAQPILLIS